MTRAIVPKSKSPNRPQRLQAPARFMTYVFAVNLKILTGVVLVNAALAQVPDVSFQMTHEAAGTPQLVADADDIAAAKNSRRSGKSAAVPCGWIGVRVQRLTAAFADSLGMAVSYGAIFARPKPGSPAAKAKIEAGDVVTAVNGSPVANWRDFAPMIAKMAPGTTVYLTTWRNGELIDVAATVGSSKCSAGRRASS
jgi:S1-C subfamily serine protease